MLKRDGSSDALSEPMLGGLKRLCRSEVRRIGLQAQEWEDVFQEAIVRILEKEGGISQVRNRAWQRILARNVARERLRAQCRVVLADMDHAPARTAAPAGPRPSLRVVLEEHGAVLTARQREALRAVIGRESPAEASRLRRIGRKAVKRRLTRACVRLSSVVDRARSYSSARSSSANPTNTSQRS